MKTIELNEQQVQFLQDYLMHASEGQEWLSNTSLAIIDSIIVKLINEQGEE